MRFSAEAIAEAFEITGLNPIRRHFNTSDEDGCGIKAYATAHEEFRGRPENVSLLEIGREMFEGFTTGWDGYPTLDDERVLVQYGGPEGAMKYYDGFEIGRAAADRVFAREMVPA